MYRRLMNLLFLYNTLKSTAKSTKKKKNKEKKKIQKNMRMQNPKDYKPPSHLKNGLDF